MPLRSTNFIITSSRNTALAKSIATGSLFSIAIYITSNILATQASKNESVVANVPSNKQENCASKAYLIYNDENTSVNDKIVALSSPRHIVSHASVALIGASNLARKGEATKSGLKSAKGFFIYEIPNEKIRLILFKFKFIDTTVISEKAFKTSNAENSLIPYDKIIINGTGRNLRILKKKSENILEHRIFLLPYGTVKSYMKNHFSPGDYDRRICS